MSLKEMLQSIFEEESEIRINKMVQIFKDNKVLTAKDLQYVDKEILEKMNIFLPIEINKILSREASRNKYLDFLYKKQKRLNESRENLQQKLTDSILCQTNQKQINSPAISFSGIISVINQFIGSGFSIPQKLCKIGLFFAKKRKYEEGIKIIKDQLDKLQCELTEVESEIKSLSFNEGQAAGKVPSFDRRKSGHEVWEDQGTLNDFKSHEGPRPSLSTKSASARTYHSSSAFLDDFPLWADEDMHRDYFGCLFDNQNKGSKSMTEEKIYEHIHIYGRMLQHFVPFDATPDEPQGFFFASENAEKTEDKLLVLIHGNWASRNLSDASPIPYVEQAYKEGYEVVLLNTSQNRVNCGSIRGSENEKKHALYVWDNFIMRRVKAKHIVIMAHSYGGDVTVSLANQRTDSFLKGVSAIGFSDLNHSLVIWTNNTIKDFFKGHAKNWVPSGDELDTLQSDSSCNVVPRVSAGHKDHKLTSESCRKSMFKFFEDELRKKKKNGRSFKNMIINIIIFIIIIIIIVWSKTYDSHHYDDNRYHYGGDRYYHEGNRYHHDKHHKFRNT